MESIYKKADTLRNRPPRRAVLYFRLANFFDQFLFFFAFQKCAKSTSSVIFSILLKNIFHINVQFAFELAKNKED